MNKIISTIANTKVGAALKFAAAAVKPHVPAILTGTGSVLSAAAVGTAVAETLKPERTDILRDHAENVEKLNGASVPVVAKEYAKTSAKLARNYKWTIICETGALACNIGSFLILRKRNVLLTAELAGALAVLGAYRGTVQNEIGEQREAELYYGLTNPREVMYTNVYEEDGNEVTEEEKCTEYDLDAGKVGYSPFAFIFDETNEAWHKSRTLNMAQIHVFEEVLTDKMNRFGWITANDVADVVNLPRSESGALYAKFPKKYGGASDVFRFKIIDIDTEDGSCACLLDFDIDGLVEGNVGKIIKMKNAEDSAI